MRTPVIDDGEQGIALRKKVAKAAAYLLQAYREGNRRVVTVDLFTLGALGQLVALELHKRLTAEERSEFERDIADAIATDAPRVRQRQILDNLGKLYDRDHHAVAPPLT